MSTTKGILRFQLRMTGGGVLQNNGSRNRSSHAVILEGGTFKYRLKDLLGMSTTKGILRFQLRMTNAKASYRITGGGIIFPTLSSSR